MILHILKNDLRRSRWSILMYFLGLGALALFMNLSTAWEAHSSIGGLIMLVLLISAVLLACNAVLADAPTHPDGQWHARPIGWARLLAAKLLYVVLIVWLPTTLVGGAMWLGSFTPAQAAWSGLEIGMYLAGILALAVAVAAASKNLQLAMGFASAIWGCLVICAISMGALRSYWQPPRLKVDNDTLIVGLFVGALALGLVLTCWQFRVRRPMHAVLPLCFIAGLFPLCFPEVRQTPQAVSPLPAALKLASVNDAGQGQVFFHNLRLEGLPSDQFATPYQIQLKFEDADIGYGDASYDLLANFAESLVMAQLPTGATIKWERHAPSVDKLLRRASQTGAFRGDLALELSRCIALGSMPIKMGATIHKQGYHARISQILDQGGSRSVRVARAQPTLLFSGDSSVKRTHHSRRRTTLFVAYNSSRNHGRAIRNHGYGSRGDGWPILELGHDQFMLGKGEDRLFVFRFANLARHSASFDFPQHQVQGPPVAKSAPKTFRDDPANILARVPLSSGERAGAYTILDKELNESHLPALIKALPRDPELARFLGEPEWVTAAREPLLAHLKRRRPNTPSVLLVRAGGLPDADLADLRWHLLHSSSGVSGLYGAMKSRTDLDAESALAEAWARRRLLGMWDLQNYALKSGLPGAFEGALREEIRQSSGRLFELVEGYQGKRKDFGAWLVQHAPDLRYDPNTRRYH